MKKLMFTAVVAMLGIVASAASCSWSALGMEALESGASITTVTYAFDASTFTQQDFLDSWRAHNDDWKSYGTLGEFVDVGFAAGAIDGYADGASVNMWTVFFDDTGKNALLSDIVSDVIGSKGQDPGLGFDLTEASAKGIFDATQAGAFAANGAGWYTTPEPTSGLLLLLGLGVMALRRKRA